MRVLAFSVTFLQSSDYNKWNDISEDNRTLLILHLTSELSILRAKARITQEKLANAIGISRQTYGQIENGKIQMSWTIYLSLLFFYSSRESTAKLLETLEIYPNAYMTKEIK